MGECQTCGSPALAPASAPKPAGVAGVAEVAGAAGVAEVDGCPTCGPGERRGAVPSGLAGPLWVHQNALRFMAGAYFALEASLDCLKIGGDLYGRIQRGEADAFRILDDYDHLAVYLTVFGLITFSVTSRSGRMLVQRGRNHTVRRPDIGPRWTRVLPAGQQRTRWLIGLLVSVLTFFAVNLTLGRMHDMGTLQVAAEARLLCEVAGFVCVQGAAVTVGRLVRQVQHQLEQAPPPSVEPATAAVLPAATPWVVTSRRGRH